MNQQNEQKWRPSLAMIVAGVLVIVLSLPAASLVLFRFYDNQLVRETETELIAQGAALAAVFALFVTEEEVSREQLGARVPKPSAEPMMDNLAPQTAELDLAAETILPPRPDAVTGSYRSVPAYRKIATRLTKIIKDTQRKTLAGFRILDPMGTVIAGREEIGLSLAHVAEIETALNGGYQSVVRQRISDKPLPSIASVSRGTGIRIFVAMPVIVQDRVAGVIYLSRTPSNVLKQLYQQRWKVLAALGFVLLATFAIAWIFVRTIKVPLTALQARSKLIGQGNRDALAPLEQHGSREIAELSGSMLKMAGKLFDRGDYINTFATHVSHELKSPLTAIKGAAELLQDEGDAMSTKQRQRFSENIIDAANRLSVLLDRLRQLAKADNPLRHGSIEVGELIDKLAQAHSEISIGFSGDGRSRIAMAEENAMIVFSNLVENAINHQASTVDIALTRKGDVAFIVVGDNGNGISAANAEKIFELFFTTRREENGTGMGLGIIRAMLHAHGGTIRLVKSESPGAAFEVAIALAPNVTKGI